MMKILPFVSLLLAVAACAQTPDLKAPASPPAEKTATPREIHLAAVEKVHQENLQKHGKNADMLVLPGVLADRKAKRVVLQAESTGLTGQGDPPEFFVIAPNSGHDYEALAVAFAKPSDIHRALLFIGIEPGRRVDFEKFDFWPKGERLLMSLSYRDAKGALVGPFRMEKLFLDKRTGKSLGESGLVFTGSAWVESKEEAGKKIYAADVYEPNSVAANYNEPTTVLDVPRRAPQKETYNNLTINPEFHLPERSMIEIMLEPEYKDGKKRVVDLVLRATKKPETAGADLGQVVFTLTEAQGKALVSQEGINGALEAFTKLTKDGRDPFVALDLDKKLTVGALHELCLVLNSIDTETGIRMEAPRADDLYYRAFVPDQGWKDRATRFAQPWELRLAKKGEGVSGVLTQIKQAWKGEQIKPDLEVTEIPVGDAAALRKELDARGPGLGVILVFAPPAMTYREILAFVAEARKTHPLIHVFVER